MTDRDDRFEKRAFCLFELRDGHPISRPLRRVLSCMRCRFRHLIGCSHLSLRKEVYMESNPDPTYIAIRIEPEGLRERRDRRSPAQINYRGRGRI